MNRILAFFCPPKCPYCSKPLKYDMTECLVCRAKFPKMPRIEPLPTGEICVAPFTYSSVIRKAILDYKFKGKKFNAESLAGAMAASIRNVYNKDMSFELITCVPMSNDRKKVRGFNQSELIAQYAAKLLDKPFEKLLCRDDGAMIQHELTYEQRINNQDKTFHVLSAERIKGKKLLLIDDVMTTGSTLSRCSSILKDAGAERVFCAAVAIVKGYSFTNTITCYQAAKQKEKKKGC